MATAKAKHAIPAGCYAPNKIPAKWRAIVFGIPGYDSTRGAAGCWFDPESAQLAIAFFSDLLVHIEGAVAGQPFVLEPWQAAIVGNLFGWKKRDSKGRIVRRYRELFVYVPRKNGKTPLCAGIGLFTFFVDPEMGQQGYIAAKDREQAGILFRFMSEMVKQSPHLKSKCKIYGGGAQAGQSKSFVKSDGSFLKVISGDGGGKHGGNPHIVIVDELHEQDNRQLLDALQSSMVSANRPQSLTIYLTTADYERPSPCNEKYDWAKKVRDNAEKDQALLPVIYEASIEDDPYSPRTWAKCNPNLGVSVSVEALARDAEKARDNPAYAVEFKRLFLNIRTHQVVKSAIDMGLWQACDAAVDLDALTGQPCWAGMDFGWRDDLAAVVLVFPHEDETVSVVPYFWLPEEGKRDLRLNPMASFVAARHVLLTPGKATDIEAIYDVLRMARERFDLRTIAYDPNNARKQGQDLMAEGFKVLEFHQSKKNYSEPWKWLMAHGLKAKKLRHGGHPVMGWMAGNAAVEVDGLDGVMPKKKASAEKIDGICAMCMGIGAWLIDPDKHTSVYESRGLRSIGGDDDADEEGSGEGEADEDGSAPIDWSSRIFDDEDE